MSRNIIGISLVSLFMQFGSTLVYSTSNSSIGFVLFSEPTFLLIRSLTESIPGLVKVISGFISDKIQNRKLFLLLGYGSIIFFKIIFFICSLHEILPKTFASIIPVLFVITLSCDRIMNCLRDAPRDALISDSTPKELRGISFGIRKFIGSLGSILGAIVVYFVLKKNLLSTSGLFLISIIPICIATCILYVMIKDVKEDNFIPINLINPFQLLNFVLSLVTTLILTISSSMKFNCLIFFLINTLRSLELFSENPTKNQNNLLKVININQVIMFFIFYSLLSQFPLLDTYLGAIFAIYTVNKRISIPFSIASILLTIALQIPTNIGKKLFIAIFCFTEFQLRKYGFFKAMQNSNMKSHWFNIIIACLLSLCKLNDIMFFNKGQDLYGNRIILTKLFGLLYVSIGIFSIIYGYLMHKNKNKTSIFLTSLCLSSANFLLYRCSNMKELILAIILLGGYNSGADTVITSILSMNLNRENRGTIFGLYYTLSCFFNILSGIFIFKIKNSLGLKQMLKIFSVLPMITFFIYLVFKNYIQKKSD